MVKYCYKYCRGDANQMKYDKHVAAFIIRRDILYPYFFVLQCNMCKKYIDSLDGRAKTSLVKQVIDMLDDRKLRSRDH